MSMKLLKRIVVTSPVSSVVYSIPSGYDDFMIRISARTTDATVSSTRIDMKWNSLSTGYFYKNAQLTGSTLASTNSTAFFNYGGVMTNAGYSASFFGGSDFYISSIPADTLQAYQSQISDGVAPNNSATNTSLYFGGSSNTTYLLDKTSFTLTPQLGNFAVGTTFSIYGIRKWTNVNSSSLKATGGDIMYHNGFVYHFFYENTNFIPNQNITGLNYLIVGGGGGGDFGNDNGRRGGNGGQVQTGTTNVTSGTTYPIVVGAGGLAWTSQPALAGSPSSAFSITATGGLAEQNSSGTGAAGTLVSNFSMFGESGYFAGQGATGSPSGSATYAGGIGGGGRGGGLGYVNGSAGWSFTGGGGGGGNDAGNASGAGGSGVVIVRYAI
jgi:hypothetical protein